jgi:hypothetical protein
MNQLVKSLRGGEHLIRSHAEPGSAAMRRIVATRSALS